MKQVYLKNINKQMQIIIINSKTLSKHIINHIKTLLHRIKNFLILKCIILSTLFFLMFFYIK